MEGKTPRVVVAMIATHLSMLALGIMVAELNRPAPSVSVEGRRITGLWSGGSIQFDASADGKTWVPAMPPKKFVFGDVRLPLPSSDTTFALQRDYGSVVTPTTLPQLLEMLRRVPPDGLLRVGYVDEAGTVRRLRVSDLYGSPRIYIVEVHGAETWTPLIEMPEGIQWVSTNIPISINGNAYQGIRVRSVTTK